MSLDFPSRSTWLALRNLQPRAPRPLHISARLLPIEQDGKLIGYNVERQGRTYRKNAKPRAPEPQELTRLPKPVQTAVRTTLEKAKRDASWLDL